jgi:hypothetical protein
MDMMWPDTHMLTWALPALGDHLIIFHNLNISPGRDSDPEPYKYGARLQRTVADPEVT